MLQFTFKHVLCAVYKIFWFPLKRWSWMRVGGVGDNDMEVCVVISPAQLSRQPQFQAFASQKTQSRQSSLDQLLQMWAFTFFHHHCSRETSFESRRQGLRHLHTWLLFGWRTKPIRVLVRNVRGATPPSFTFCRFGYLVLQPLWPKKQLWNMVCCGINNRTD